MGCAGSARKVPAVHARGQKFWSPRIHLKALWVLVANTWSQQRGWAVMREDTLGQPQTSTHAPHTYKHVRTYSLCRHPYSVLTVIIKPLNRATAYYEFIGLELLELTQVSLPLGNKGVKSARLVISAQLGGGRRVMSSQLAWVTQGDPFSRAGGQPALQSECLDSQSYTTANKQKTLSRKKQERDPLLKQVINS